MQAAISIFRALQDGSPLIYFIIFWGGFILSLGICGIVRIPIVIGYVGSTSQSRKQSIAISISFITGLIFSYCVIGMSLALIGSLMGYIILWQSYAYYILSVVLIVAALHFIGIITIKFTLLPANIKESILKKASGTTVSGAFFLGITFVFFEGIICPCCAPILYLIASHTLLKGEIWYGLSLFFVYALGQATPIFLAGYFAGWAKYLTGKRKHWEYVEVTTGLVLLLAGMYLFMIA